MVYIISYILRPNNEHRTTEWIVPEGWSPATIAAHFEQQIPAAEVVRVEPQP
jgi:hypothetical protein